MMRSLMFFSSEKKRKAVVCFQPAFFILSLCSALWLSPAQALADCSTDNPPTCDYVPNGITLMITPQQSGLFPACKEVTDNCGKDIMVPHRDQNEWNSFITNHEACAALGDCSPSWVVTWGACSVACGGGNQSLSSYYCQAKNGSGVFVTVSNNVCTSSGLSPPPSSEACNTQVCAVNGACGAANGGSDANPPWTDGSNLCSAGTAANGANTGSTWTWTCNGSYGGSNASCSEFQPCSATVTSTKSWNITSPITITSYSLTGGGGGGGGGSLSPQFGSPQGGGGGGGGGSTAIVLNGSVLNSGGTPLVANGGNGGYGGIGYTGSGNQGSTGQNLNASNTSISVSSGTLAVYVGAGGGGGGAFGFDVGDAGGGGGGSGWMGGGGGGDASTSVSSAGGGGGTTGGSAGTGSQNNGNAGGEFVGGNGSGLPPQCLGYNCSYGVCTCTGGYGPPLAGAGGGNNGNGGQAGIGNLNNNLRSGNGGSNGGNGNQGCGGQSCDSAGGGGGGFASGGEGGASGQTSCTGSVYTQPGGGTGGIGDDNGTNGSGGTYGGCNGGYLIGAGAPRGGTGGNGGSVTFTYTASSCYLN
jgi:hypothetical protein